MIKPSNALRSAAAIILGVLGTAAAVSLTAQSRMMPDAPGTWKAWKFTAVPSARQERAATPAEVKAFEAQLLALNVILQRAPGVATPRGYSVETWGHLAGYPVPAPDRPAGSSAPLGGGVAFGAFSIFEYERNGKTIRQDTGETDLLQFQVNQLDAAALSAARLADFGQGDAEAFLEPAATGEVAGLSRYGDVLIIKKNPKPLWVPVSMATAIGLIAATHTKQLAEERAALDRVRASLADWLDPAKRQQRFAGYAIAAAAQPDKAKFLADMEQVERDAIASTHKDLTPQGGTMKRYLEFESALADASAWLQGLAPADRAAPACYVKSGSTPRDRFRAGSSTGCVPVVQPDWAFFDPSLPRSTPQVIVIPQVSRCFENQPAKPATPAGCPANRQLLLTLDKEAVLAWLR
jgi:hypothetical protein